MARGKLWGYVASGARVFGGLGAFGGVGGAGAGGGHGGGADGDAAAAGGPVRLPRGPMAGPRALSRSELERVHWTDRGDGCGPQAPHVQVAESVRRVLRGGGRAGAVVTRIPAGLPVVVADGRQLESALAGLVDHAIRRSLPGDRVLIRADVVPGRPGSGVAGRARVELRVVDRGSSVLPEARQWLLAGLPAAGPAGATGDGLVRAAGGRLAVEQTPGGGLTVVLTLAVALD
ncbi:hypothetical protein OH807_07885 [Kitasatospora sp. NBC_01560]|uniref:hypothetical protein n=1 Tax=Kitasatospora sp. NBC_01560 TaxID=2975965 RepID=UPI003867181D